MSARWRSVLFAPAHEPRKTAKAVAGAADQVVLDLEAAVPNDQKLSARKQLAADLPGFGRRPWVRVNDLTTACGAADLASLELARIAGIVAPLINSADDLQRADQMLAERERACGLAAAAVPLLPVIETCQGLVALGAIAGAKLARSMRLSFGAWDFTLDSGIAYTRAEEGLALARQLVVVHSKAADRPAPIDASYPYLDDADGFAQSCRRAKALGMGGKACIHPAQVEPANSIFAPSAAQLEQARALITAFEDAGRQGKAAIRFRGEFVDRPMYERALQIIESAGGEAA